MRVCFLPPLFSPPLFSSPFLPPLFLPPPSLSLFPYQITPLHLACREGHLRVVNVLLEHRADVTNIDQNGFNALDLAIENGHRYITLPLLKDT